jgi:hypothetical protein
MADIRAGSTITINLDLSGLQAGIAACLLAAMAPLFKRNLSTIPETVEFIEGIKRVCAGDNPQNVLTRQTLELFEQYLQPVEQAISGGNSTAESLTPEWFKGMIIGGKKNDDDEKPAT